MHQTWKPKTTLFSNYGKEAQWTRTIYDKDPRPYDLSTERKLEYYKIPVDVSLTR